jgi:hypothetical protein
MKQTQQQITRTDGLAVTGYGLFLGKHQGPPCWCGEAGQRDLEDLAAEAEFVMLTGLLRGSESGRRVAQAIVEHGGRELGAGHGQAFAPDGRVLDPGFELAAGLAAPGGGQQREARRSGSVPGSVPGSVASAMAWWALRRSSATTRSASTGCSRRRGDCRRAN